MQNTVVLVAMLAFAILSIGNAGCSKSATSSQDTVNASTSLPANGNFRLSLTDAPHPSLSHVIVNVDHIELLLEKDGKQGRLVLAQDLGPLDLLKLRDGVHLPIRDLDLKENVVVKQFRLILKDEGNWIQRLADDSICQLKTPSQQQTGLKLIMPNGGVQVEKDQIYSLIVDFDVDHSIVDNKNNCLLRPVLKVKSLLSVPQDDDSSGSGDNTADDNNGGTDNSGNTGDNTNGGTTSGGDTTTGGTTDGGSTTIGDTASGGDTTSGGDTSSGGVTSGDTSSGGSTTGGDTSSGDTTSGDTTGGTTSSGDGTNTSTGTDPGDGAPIVIEGDSTFFNS